MKQLMAQAVLLLALPGPTLAQATTSSSHPTATDEMQQEIAALRIRVSDLEAQLRHCLGQTDTQQSPPPFPNPSSLYHAAYNDYLKGNYDLALRGFSEYLRNFPDSGYAPDAQFYVGETYYRQQRYRQAVDEFTDLFRRYPGSSRVEAALLKRGYAHIELGERAQGVADLRELIQRFPATDQANLARQRLTELGIEHK